MESINLTLPQKILCFIGLSLAAFMMVLDYSIANVSIPYIAGDLSVSTDEGTYVITSFAVGNAIGLAMTGWLSKRIGSVKLLTLSILLFTFFSWACGASFNLELLVINRFIQGFVSGPIIPLSQSLLIGIGTVKTRSRDIAIFAGIIIAAPVLGPILGGYISEWHVWSWIFYINIPIGLFCAAIVWFIMRPMESIREEAPLDLIGFILLVLGVTALQIFLDKGQQWDWLNSNTIRALIIVSSVSFVLLIIRELYHETPLMELRLFSIPTFTLSIVCLAVSYAIYFGSVVIVPLWLQEYMNYDAVWAGLSVSTLGIGPLVFTIFTPKVVRTLGITGALLVSFTLFSAACFYNAYFTTQVDVETIALGRFFFGCAMTFYMGPLLSLSISNLSMEKMPAGTGIFHFVRSMIGGVGTSVFTTLFERRTIFHHERLGSALTSYNPLLPKNLDQQNLALLNQSLDQQASMLAINDAFFLMGWMFVCLVLLLAFWIIRKKAPRQVVSNSQIVVE